jgi:ComF family protein
LIIDFFKDLIQGAIDLAYPEVCRACLKTEIRTPELSLICTDCITRIIYTKQWSNHDNMLYKRLREHLRIDKAASLMIYEELSVAQNLLHNFKYKKLTEIGHHFGEILANRMVEHKWHEGIDCIVPIPMTKSKERLRGFNTAQILSEEISAKTNLPIVKDALIKTKNTVSQTQMGKKAREENATLLFKIQNKSAIQKKHVMLVDDIITTGSTISDAGIELWTHGISNLSIAALCTANNKNYLQY